jgi:quercetin dioxygenase-like cupin family protein
MLHIPFPKIPWQSKAPGQRQKALQQEGKQIRVMEITPEFVEPDWCTKGHIGMVLEGTMELEFKHQTFIYQPGDAFMIPAGAEHGHKAKAVSPIVRMIIVEDA